MCGQVLEFPTAEVPEVIEFWCKGRDFPGWFHEYRRDGNRYTHTAVREAPSSVDWSEDVVPAVYMESKRKDDRPLRYWKCLTVTQ